MRKKKKKGGKKERYYLLSLLSGHSGQITVKMFSVSLIQSDIIQETLNTGLK